MADQLRDIALMIEQTVLPMGDQYSHPKIEISVPLAEVEWVAKTLGVDVVVDSAGRHSAIYKPAGEKPLVRAEWFQYLRDGKPDADATVGQDDSRDATPLTRDEQVEVADRGHYQTSGWTGSDGGSGVACACGTTFDGFDSLAAAGEQLKRHINDATAHDRIDAT
jgi:hypothetical protein